MGHRAAAWISAPFPAQPRPRQQCRLHAADQSRHHSGAGPRSLRRGDLHVRLGMRSRRSSAWLPAGSSRTPFFLYGDSSFPPPEIGLSAKVRAFFLRRLFARATGFMVSGKLNADYYRHYGANQKTFFPAAVGGRQRAVRGGRPDDAAAGTLRNQPRRGGDSLLGEARPRKDPMTLLRAFEPMAPRGRAVLVFMGDGELRAELETYAREHQIENVHFTGFINQREIPAHYAMSDVFVLPSVYEPRGAVINEAMACGLPVIVTDRCGSIGDIVQENENAFIYPGRRCRRAPRRARRDRRRRPTSRANGSALARDHRRLGLRARRRRRAGDAGTGETMKGITVAIPTYQRGAILVETIEHLLQLPDRADEILIVDQTRSIPWGSASGWRAGSAKAVIRWMRLSEPSVPHAMNVALRSAENPVVLFIDDDIVPGTELVARASEGPCRERIWAVAGQVLQPAETARHFMNPHGAVPGDLEFAFNHDTECDVENVMAGNLSLDRSRALSIGGFDENFTGAAYRFESDFARSDRRSRRPDPVRSAGDLAPSAPPYRRNPGSWRPPADRTPAHSAGDYYFARWHVAAFRRYAARRFIRNVFTKWHLRHPWTLPAKIVAEIRGYRSAARLHAAGRRLIQ